MSEELKPCPFCGGVAEELGSCVHWISCADCRAESYTYDTLEEAIEAWNRRVNN